MPSKSSIAREVLRYAVPVIETYCKGKPKSRRIRMLCEFRSVVRDAERALRSNNPPNLRRTPRRNYPNTDSRRAWSKNEPTLHRRAGSHRSAGRPSGGRGFYSNPSDDALFYPWRRSTRAHRRRRRRYYGSAGYGYSGTAPGDYG